MIGLGCLLYLSGNKSTAFVPLKVFSFKKPTGGGVWGGGGAFAVPVLSQYLSFKISDEHLCPFYMGPGEINQLQNFTKNVWEQPFYVTQIFCSRTQFCTQRARILQLLIFTGPLIVRSKFFILHNVSNSYLCQ